MLEATRLMDRIYATGQVETQDGRLLDAFPSGVPRGHADEIVRLVRDLKLTRTLEVGLAYGLSALAICGVHEERGEGEHIAIDPAQANAYGSIGRLNLERAGVADRVRIIEARSDRALPQLREEGVRLDFALVDGRHIFDTALVDFYFCDLMLDVGGVVMLHDTWLPSQAQVAAYVRTNRAYELLTTGGDGTIAAFRKLAHDRRRWYFHRDFAFDRRAWWARARFEVGRRVGAIPWPPPTRRHVP